jgi:predicted transcriptional regulator
MSRIRDGAEIRRQRILKLLDLIENNQDLAETKIKGLFLLQTGLTTRKIDEYLNDLETAGLIKREDGRLSRMC